MMFGLATSEYDYIRKTVVMPLANCDAQVYCFGSRARGDHSRFSDLDLMVESDKDLSNLIGELKERLTESNFPYKVDLVEFRHFAESYKADYLQERKLFPSQPDIHP